MKTSHPLNRWSLVFIITIILLLGIGTLFVFEASLVESLTTFGDQFHLVKLHLLGLAVGSIGLLAISFVPPKFWLKISPLLYALGIFLLLAVFLPIIGLELNGASRWIGFAQFNLQPVELFKFAMIVFFASWLANHQRFLPFSFLLSLPIILLFLQPDLGSIIIISVLAVGLYFLAGGKLINIAAIAALAIPLLLVTVIFSPYRLQRLTTFIDPTQDPLGSSFQIHQITVALGQGGVLGQGIGNSSQKFAYIPEASTDSIFAITAEELGLVGSLLVLSLYILFILAGFKIISTAQQPQAVKLAAQGMLLWIATQTLLNLGAIVGLVPLTGVPLPFFSYGRSAQIMILLASGFVLSLRRNPK